MVHSHYVKDAGHCVVDEKTGAELDWLIFAVSLPHSASLYQGTWHRQLWLQIREECKSMWSPALECESGYT